MAERGLHSAGARTPIDIEGSMALLGGRGVGEYVFANVRPNVSAPRGTITYCCATGAGVCLIGSVELKLAVRARGADEIRVERKRAGGRIRGELRLHQIGVDLPHLELFAYVRVDERERDQAQRFGVGVGAGAIDQFQMHLLVIGWVADAVLHDGLRERSGGFLYFRADERYLRRGVEREEREQRGEESAL